MKPNPVLTPIKWFIKKHGGWGRRFAPAQPLPVEDSTGSRVFVIEPRLLAPERRFAVVAPTWEKAHDRIKKADRA